MQDLDFRYINQRLNAWARVRQRLVYLPGAMVLAYGFWLTLTV